MSNESELIKNLVESVIKELDNKKILKKKQLTPYQKTEQVLYSYKVYQMAIQDKMDRIEEIKRFGLKKRSGSIISMPHGGIKKDDREKELEAIETFQNSIVVTQRFVGIIEEALKKIEREPYHELIELIYFEKKTIDEVADRFNVDSSTISRRRKQLVNQLSIYLFSDEVIQNLYVT